MKYKLIQEYPGSPELGTIVDSDFNYYVVEGDCRYPNLSNWNPSEYPKLWELVPESKELTIKHIEHLITLTTFRWGGGGGQHVNKADSAVKLSCQELRFEIVCNYHRSLYKNREVCLNALQSFLDDLPDSVKQHYLNE